MERMMSVGQPGRVGRFRPEQIATRATWSGIPESPAMDSTLAALHKVDMQGHHASTIVHVNPLDPYYEEGRAPSWRECPHDENCHCPRRTMRY